MTVLFTKEEWIQHLSTWWEALVNPDVAGRLVVRSDEPPGFTRFLAVGGTALYLVYGFSMGLQRGLLPAFVSGLKLPLMFLFTLVVCLPAFYGLNCLAGTRLHLRQSLRLHLIAISANAGAIASCALISYLFTLAGAGYRFLVWMHLVIFVAAGAVGLVVMWRAILAAAVRLSRRLHPVVVVTWAALYVFVGTEMAWALRPWIGTRSLPYQPLRPIEGSFFEAIVRLVFG